MDEKGYIKFECEWLRSAPLSSSEIKLLNVWRDKLYSLGLIGAYENGIGFGNISARIRGTQNFIITGSATGTFKKLTGAHYTKVVAFDIEKNYVKCIGPIKASSESMTHAVIYGIDPEINAVIHVHSLEFWKRLLHNVPTTSQGAAYGTPEMAAEVIRLFKETDVREKKILVMHGHEEGILTFGRDLDEAGKVLLEYLKSFQT